MDQWWRFLGWLLAALTTTPLCMMLISAAFAFRSPEKGRVLRGVLANELLVRGYGKGLSITAFRSFMIKHIFAENSSSETGEGEISLVERISIAAYIAGETDPHEIERLVRNADAMYRRAAHQVESLAESAGSVDSLLLRWNAWIIRDFFACAWLGWRRFLPGMGRRLIRQAAAKIGEATAISTVLALVIWYFWQGGSRRGEGEPPDWVAYVGGWAAIAAVTGVVWAISAETVAIFTLVSQSKARRISRGRQLVFLGGGLGLVFACLAFQYFGVAQTLSRWLELRAASMDIRISDQASARIASFVLFIGGAWFTLIKFRAALAKSDDIEARVDDAASTFLIAVVLPPALSLAMGGGAEVQAISLWFSGAFLLLFLLLILVRGVLEVRRRIAEVAWVRRNHPVSQGRFRAGLLVSGVAAFWACPFLVDASSRMPAPMSSWLSLAILALWVVSMPLSAIQGISALLLLRRIRVVYESYGIQNVGVDQRRVNRRRHSRPPSLGSTSQALRRRRRRPGRRHQYASRAARRNGGS